MRPRTKPVPGNHDLLMQTLMNVVGVLIVMLALMQMRAKDAVSQTAKSSDADTVSLEELANVEKNLNLTRADIAKRQREVQAAEATVAETRNQVDAARKQIATLRGSVPATLPGDNSAQLQSQRTKIEEQRKVAESLKANKSQLEAKKNELETSIKEAPPKAEQPPPRSINPPNPRPAPQRISPVEFVCHHGRIVPFNEEALHKNAIQRMNRAAAELVRDGGIDCEALKSLFEKDEKIGNAFFHLKVTIVGKKAKLVIEHRPDSGDDAKTVSATDSLFQQRLKDIDSGRQYIRFHVYPDSFEVYLAAREALNNRIPAGWQPELENVPHLLDLKLPGELNCVGMKEEVQTTLKPTPDAGPNAPPKNNAPKGDATKSDPQQNDATNADAQKADGANGDSNPSERSIKKQAKDKRDKREREKKEREKRQNDREQKEREKHTPIIKLPDQTPENQIKLPIGKAPAPAAPTAPPATSRKSAPNDDID